MFTSADTLAAINSVSTIGELRAALGVLADFLRLGYDRLPDISSDQGLRDATHSYLDTVNAYVQKIYNGQPQDVPAQRFEVGFVDAGRLGFAAGQVDDVLHQVAQAAKVSEFELGPAIQRAVDELKQNVTDVATGIGEATGDVISAPLKGATAALSAFLYGARVALVIIVVGGIVYVFRKPIIAAISKVGG